MVSVTCPKQASHTSYHRQHHFWVANWTSKHAASTIAGSNIESNSLKEPREEFLLPGPACSKPLAPLCLQLVSLLCWKSARLGAEGASTTAASSQDVPGAAAKPEARRKQLGGFTVGQERGKGLGQWSHVCPSSSLAKDVHASSVQGQKK